MSSDWQKLADLWYRKREVYATHWADEPDRLHLSVVAGAPYGGPVATVRNEHVFQPVRGSLKPELQTWTSAGRLIASTPWVHTGLLAMGWSSQERLVCVFENGVVRTFTVMCEQLSVFTVDERVTTEGGAVLASIWPDGIALLTRKHSLFVNLSFSRSGDACQRFAEIRVGKPPLCMCILPPPREGSSEVQVVLGTAEGPVLIVDRHESRDLGLDEGPYMAFAASSSGRLLAGLSEKGVFKVLSVTDDLRVLDVANIECRKRPKQMVWCGDDCIALYLAVPTPSNSMQHVLFVGGPQNDWIPYQYDTPLHLVSECDGCRILGAHKVEFVQRVPQSIEAIYSIGNCDPPAMLCFALERYEKGDVCAQESLRLIKDDLAEAVATCVDAAQHEHEAQTVQSLLNAAVFGRHFLSEPPDPTRFVDTCRNLRICSELRKAPIDVPLTVPQLERVGVGGLITRLAQRRHHLLAVRICEWVGHPREKVLFHWACEKIRSARGSPCTDEQLCEAVLEKFKGCAGIGYAEVARVAAEMYRPHLATMLVNHEPRSHAQVQVLLQLAREGDDENHLMMLRIAIERAALSSDPDLIHGALAAALGGDPCGRDVEMPKLLRLLKERPQDLQIVADVLASALQRGKLFDRARSFCEQLGRARLAAHTCVCQVYSKREAEERHRWLKFARDMFNQTEPSLSEAERASAQLCAQASTDEAELLQAQLSLEEQAQAKRWTGGPHRFAGLPLVTTLCRLIGIGEIVEADNLHTKMKMSDKRYWRVKVRALGDAGKLEDLNMMATHRTSPIGYELIVETFLKHGRKDLAQTFVPRVKDPEQQASYYSRMGMEEEARAALAQRSDRAGVVGVFQNLLRRG